MRMNAQALQRYAAKIPVATSQKLLYASAVILRGIYNRAVDRSTGTTKTAQLRLEDHPYARRHGRPRRDPSIINVQSGLFISQWARNGPMPHAAGAHGEVSNDTPYAQFLESGTIRMFQRPLTERVVKELEPWATRELARALREAIR